MYNITRSPLFIKQTKNVDGFLLDKIKKQIRKIIENPKVGKPLKYKRGERTIYIKPFRLIYSVIGENIVLLKFDHKKVFMGMEMNYRKAVFIVTYSKTKKGIEFILLKRKLHWKGWEFPKGGLEKWEEIRKAVVREVKEETGLKVLKVKKFNVFGKYKYSKKLEDRPGFVGQSYVLYSAEVRKRKVKVDGYEHNDFKWLSFEKALKKLTWGNQRKCLKMVNNSL